MPNRSGSDALSDNVRDGPTIRRLLSDDTAGAAAMPARIQDKKSSREEAASQQLFSQRQALQAQRPSSGTPVTRRKIVGRSEQELQMPSFSGSRQAEEPSSGWGQGSMDVKPLQYKTDEQIREEQAAEAERGQKLKREKREEAQRPATAQWVEIRRSQEQPRQRERPQNLDQSATSSAAIEEPPSRNRARKVLPREYSARPNPFDGYGDAGGQYMATPFNANPARASYQPSELEQHTWKHLRPRQEEAETPSSTPEQARSSSTASQQASALDESAIERNFEEHRRQRNTRVSSLFSNPNITDASPAANFSPASSRQSVRCARCLQPGHRAGDCKSPITCLICGQVGHPQSRCPKQPRRNGEQQTHQQGNRTGYNGGSGRADDHMRRFKTSAAELPERKYREMNEGNLYRVTVGDRDGEVNRRDRNPSEARRYRAEQPSRIDGPQPRPDRGWAGLEHEVEEDAVDDRRVRRSRRGFADEDDNVEDVSAPRSNERRKEVRAGRRRDFDEDADDEALAAREERAARKAARKAQEKAEQERIKAARAAGERAGAGMQVHLPEFVSVSNLAQQLGIGYEPFVQRLEKLGYDDVFPGKVLNRETSGMIAMEYDFDPVYEGAGSAGAKSEEEERDLKAAPEVEDTTFLPSRPPVVTIMGHVDHGKTTILDYLRRTSVAAGEAGGITQHIGAFSVPLSESGKTITFLDTPGHAAFMSMRQRGANVTDMVILVVAADDSVKPQTLESIRCAREAGVPMIVAVNKVDKPEADVQRVKNDLSRHGVEIEDFGGEVQVVEVSGKTGQGLDALEENVVTLSEILDHRSDTEGAVEGWVLEATTKRAGRVATVLVKRGTLRPGAILVAGKTWTRVRSLRDERDQTLMEVGPGMPVEVDGWRDQPNAGDEVLQAPDEQKATDAVAYRLEKGERLKMEEDMEAINESRRAEQERRKAAEKAARAATDASAAADGASNAASGPTTTEPQRDQPSGQQTVPLIIKADVSGSAEAVAAYIPSLTSPLIRPDILASTVGAINESDIELASASGGHIVAFNLPKNEDMAALAESKGVMVLENNIIYRTLEQVKEMLESRLPAIVTQKVVGEAEVGTVFEIGVGGRRKMKIAGCKVRNGAVARNSRVRVFRDGEKVYDGTVASLKNVKKDVAEMRKGTECGMGFDGWEGFQEGDQIQTYEESSEKRRL